MKNVIKVDIFDVINNLLYVIDKLTIVSNIDNEISFRHQRVYDDRLIKFETFFERIDSIFRQINLS